MTNENKKTIMNFDKAPVVALVVALLGQAAAIVWNISMMTSDIQRNTDEIAKIYKRLYEVEKAVQAQAVSMARIDENIGAIRKTTDAFFRTEVLKTYREDE